MGGGNSSQGRTVNIEQDEGTGMVKVTESVARRLVGKPEATGAEQKSELPANSLSPGDRATEIKKLQSQYEKRLHELEHKNKEMYQTTTESFAQAVEEVEKKFLKTTASPICQDLQQEVLQCYQANPKFTLNCSPQVKAFNECVQKQREKVLSKRG